MHPLHILLLCTFSFVPGAAVDIYIETPVTLLDCRSPREDSQWMIGTTEATTTLKPADQREFFDAARDGDLQYIENRISRLGLSGLNLDWQNPNYLKWTALHVASYENKPSIVSALLTAGANPNVQDKYGKTPVYLATGESNIDVLRHLLDPKYQADVNLADEEGCTPVYKASRKVNTTALELLLTLGGGDPNKVNDFGKSPLMEASECCPAGVRALLAAGAHVNYVSPYNGRIGGRTALHQAAFSTDPDVALMLLEAGATKDIKDSDGRTPVDMARRSRYPAGRVIELINNY